MATRTEWDHITKRGGFLEAQLGKGWQTPFTGYGWAALGAWVGLIEAWYHSDGESRPAVEHAMRSLLPTFQRSELPAVRLVIYGVGYMSAMVDLWPRVSSREA